MQQASLFESSPKPPPAAPLTWKDALHSEREKPYFKQLLAFVEGERAAGKTIYPPAADVFNALRFTEFSTVKAVILGQDPYHGPDQAHGLCFSVRPGIAAPPSLLNIFKELKSDLGLEAPQHGCLEAWAKQGVLLLNTVLTVEQSQPQSHAGKGWEQFTDKIVEVLAKDRRGLVFLLWGSPAQRKAERVDRLKHHVLTAPHPSPLSASRGFFGCRHFSTCNRLLEEQKLKPIDWRLP